MKAILTVLLLTLTGCATQVSYVPTNSPPRPMVARSPQSVDVFTSGVPDRPFSEVGLLNAREGAADDYGQMVAALREAAGQYGCDGVIITGTENEVSTNWYNDDVESRLNLYGTCIVYLDQSEPVAQPVSSLLP
ncbi:MAG: hypothetical protein KC561_07350 [Myxococcales bacterium]|nr:hypothetical protein [Myxococcales bacterium]